MGALCSLMGGAACVHNLAGKESINTSGKCHSGLARQEISKIYACCPGSMRRKTTSLTVLPVDTYAMMIFAHSYLTLFCNLIKSTLQVGRYII